MGRFEPGRDRLLFAYTGSSLADVEGGLTSGWLGWRQGARAAMGGRRFRDEEQWWLRPGYRQVGRRGQIWDTLWRQRQLDSAKDRKRVLGTGNKESRLTPRFGV